MTGKEKCKILKEIRRTIARENDIAYVTTECKHKGDCAGTCPKCEAEVQFLEKELEKQRRMGKRVAVAGIAAALVVSSSACSLLEAQPDPLAGETLAGAPEPFEQVELVGEVPYSEPSETEEPLMGDIALPLPGETGTAP